LAKHVFKDESLAKLSVRREPGPRDKIDSYKLLVDGTLAAQIYEGETKAITVTAGCHRLQMRTYWLSSPKIDLDLESDGKAEVVCRAANNGLFDLLFRWRHYIILQAASEPLPTQRTLGADVGLRMLAQLLGSYILLVITLSACLATHTSPGLSAGITAGIVIAYIIGITVIPLPRPREPKRR